MLAFCFPSPRCGDPRAPENKKRGHKIRQVNGFKGVSVPGDNEGVPWTLRRVRSSGLERQDELDIGDPDSELDPELINEKHMALKKQQDDAYNNATAGALAADAS